jgi:sugar/nucleoside kinase (ribokinase family)
MPALPLRRRSRAAQPSRAVPRPPRIAVLGDLVLDVVLTPARALESGTDVPGRVSLRQGGSAATTAIWVARLGGRSSLITSIGRDAAGRSLVAAVEAEGARVRAVRRPGARTGRIGVIVAPGGERSFVADRGAADLLAAEDVRPTWLSAIDLLHLPLYSLLPEVLGAAARRAADLARAGGALVSVDLASAGPIEATGRRAVLTRLESVRPDLLFATVAEARTLLAGGPAERLLDLAAVAVVKRGGHGATVLARAPAGDGDRSRFDVATRRLEVPDTTGAGDAFDAGFLVAWVPARREGVPMTTALHRSAVAGHRAAARHLSGSRPELALDA